VILEVQLFRWLQHCPLRQVFLTRLPVLLIQVTLIHREYRLVQLHQPYPPTQLDPAAPYFLVLRLVQWIPLHQEDQ